MKHVATTFRPVAEAHLGRDDIDVLMVCTKRHYDSVCRQAGQPGGVIWRYKNRLQDHEEVEVDMHLDDVDLLSKVVEIPHTILHADPTAQRRVLVLRAALSEMFHRLAAQTPGKVRVVS